MKAHLFADGGGMVTGCSDVKAARQEIVQVWLDANYGGITLGQLAPDDDMGRDAIAEASSHFRPRRARIESGRIVPTDEDGYSWWWRSGYKPGVRGVTTAVVWNP